MPGRTRRSRAAPPGVSARELAAAAAICLAMAAAVTWPMLARPGSGAHDRADTLFNTWLMEWNIHAVSTLANPFHPPVFLGQPDAQGRSDLLLAQSAAAVPARLAGASPLAAHNIVFAVSMAFAGFGLFMLAREAGLDRWGAMFAASAMVCAPFFQSHLWHIQLMSPGFAFLAVRQTMRVSSGTGAGWPLALLVVLQCCASLYYWLFLGVALLLALPWAAASGGSKGLARTSLWAGAGFAASAALLLAAGHFSHSSGWSPDSMASTDVSAFLSPWESSRLLGWARPSTTHGEAALWPGMAAALGTLLFLLRRKREAAGIAWGWYFALSAAVFAVFCLGPTLSVFGRPVSPAPWRLIAGLPGFSSIRLPARAGVFFLFPVMLAAGRTMRGRPMIAVLGAAMSLAEVWPGPMRLQPVEPRRYHSWLASKDFEAIAILPVGTSLDAPEHECTNLYGSMLHFTPMANGYATTLPEGYRRTAEMLNSWPSPEADSVIRELGIECLICLDRMPPDADPVWTDEPRPAAAVILVPTR